MIPLRESDWESSGSTWGVTRVPGSFAERGRPGKMGAHFPECGVTIPWRMGEGEPGDTDERFPE